MEELKKASADLNQKTEALKSGKEPVSGEQGKGTASDPFDQGNSEDGDGKSAGQSLSDTVTNTTNKISESVTGKSS